MALALGRLAADGHRRNRAHEALDGSRRLGGVQQRRVNGQAGYAGGHELPHLRRQVERHGVVDARAGVQIRAHGQQATIAVAQRQATATQPAAGAVVDAGVGDLEHAMLARHDARPAGDDEARSNGCTRCQVADLLERELGRQPHPRGAGRLEHGEARLVVDGDAAAHLGQRTALGGKREF